MNAAYRSAKGFLSHVPAYLLATDATRRATLAAATTKAGEALAALHGRPEMVAVQFHNMRLPLHA